MYAPLTVPAPSCLAGACSACNRFWRRHQSNVKSAGYLKVSHSLSPPTIYRLLSLHGAKAGDDVLLITADAAAASATITMLLDLHRGQGEYKKHMLL